MKCSNCGYEQKDEDLIEEEFRTDLLPEKTICASCTEDANIP